VKLRIYNNTLDPNIWNNDKTIKPEVRENLLKVAEDFYNSTDLEGEIQDILFIGSSANYNWTPTSDIDLHIVIDIAGEKINEEYARKFMDSLGFKWNTEHDIEMKKHPVEVYLQDVREPNSNASLSREGAAIYSLFEGKWVQEPTHEKLDLDANKIREKFKTIQEKVKRLVETNDIDKLKELMKAIRNYRDTGLSSGGEFCTENLVFKALRKSGVLKQIKDTINTVYDKQVSLPENGNIQPKTDTTKLNEDVNNYLVVGWINNNLEIVAEKDSVGNGNITHPHLMTKYPDFMYLDDNTLQWRYKSKTNTIHWNEEPSERQAFSVSEYLKEKFGISDPRNIRTSDLSAHKIDEMLDKKSNLFLGFVNRETFKTIGRSVEDNEVTHANWQQTLPREYQWHFGTESLLWRYKRTTNTVYWWSMFPDPNEDEKESVEYWLEKNVNIKYPEHKKMEFYTNGSETTEMDDNRLTAHSIDESVESIMTDMESKGFSLFCS